MNDDGVPISGYTHLLFEVKACSNLFVILSEKSLFLNGNFILTLLGSNQDRRLNGIKDSCIKCSTMSTHVQKTTLDCNAFKPFFVSWDNRGAFSVGTGLDITKQPFLEYRTKKKFSFNFLSVNSLKGNATWRFRVGE